MNCRELTSSISNTTFVQADPTTFRTIVQKLTGVQGDLSSPKLHVTTHPPDMGPRKPAFKLHERRPSAKRLEITLGDIGISGCQEVCQVRQGGYLVSPVSPLNLWPRMSPTSPVGDEERAIANKGFYLHPSPISTPRGVEPPELLPLFPLRSPRDGEDDDREMYTSF